MRHYHRVTGIEEKPDIIKYILAGIYVMTPEVFEYIPQGQYYGMDKLIKEMLAKDDPSIKYEIQDYWLDIGQINDYQKANEIYEEFLKA